MWEDKWGRSGGAVITEEGGEGRNNIIIFPTRTASTVCNGMLVFISLS